jgi:hypothetical protein
VLLLAGVVLQALPSLVRNSGKQSPRLEFPPRNMGISSLLAFRPLFRFSIDEIRLLQDC